MTGYKASQIVNAALAAAGIDKAIPPQMMYNYLKKGYIKKNSDGTVNVESLNTWLYNYLKKQGVKVVLDEQAEFDMSEAR